jgi:hypothetical protein
MTNQINAPNPASLGVHIRQQVPPSRSRLALLVAIGLSAPLWWTWIISQAGYRIYLLCGSPTHPSHALLWLSVYAPSLLLGLAAGSIATQLLRASPLKGWVIFCGSLLLGAFVEAALTQVQLSESLASLFSGFGNLCFWVGSLVWPATNHFRKPG